MSIIFIIIVSILYNLFCSSNQNSLHKNAWCEASDKLEPGFLWEQVPVKNRIDSLFLTQK
jgi:hypothetical protein